MKVTWESVVCQHDGDPVTVQRLAGNHCRWCVQYRGQGRYLISDLELLAYLKYRSVSTAALFCEIAAEGNHET